MSSRLNNENGSRFSRYFFFYWEFAGPKPSLATLPIGGVKFQDKMLLAGKSFLKMPKKVKLFSQRELNSEFFSNLAHTPFTYDGVRYESVEGLWQSLKYPDDDLYRDPRNI